jgi:hypothetical protein
MVLVIVVRTKFAAGAWIVIAAMPFVVGGFYAVHRHYNAVYAQLSSGAMAAADEITETPTNIVILYVESLNEATAEAVGYVRSFAGRGLRAVHVRSPGTPADFAASWKRFSRTDVELEILPSGRNRVSSIVELVRGIPRDRGDFVTVVIPELLRKRSLLAAVQRGTSFLLKVRLLSEPQIVITDVPVVAHPRGAGAPSPSALIPERTVALIFVSAAHDPAVRAVQYARSLRASDTRAVFVAMDQSEVEQIQREWEERRIPVALDIVEAPFRDLTSPILEEVRRVTSHHDTVAAVIIPELVLPRFRDHLLHNQRALFIKRLLLFEPRVILTSVPFHLKRRK